MRGVVLITGVMAAGKSTVAQALAETLPRAAHVRGDLFRRMIVSGREDYVPGADGEGEAQLRLRYRLSAATADAYAESGFTAVVQDVVLGNALTAYVGLVRTRPLYVVVLAPSPEAVTARETGRAKTGYGAWTVEDLDGALRADTPRLGLWLDSSELTVGETVEAILAGRERARVR
ncbi:MULTISPECIES: AAA family ATPase [unclassified Streptomyces]|uniref:AAA family ATPase n=1 Tax=unclassified Streptomyces TaxID=2593676 RepID=UPI0022551AE5|nr:MULTISPECIES: AAA family ATPase [unclassified Streptomyces]MCX4881112.1 AAA family ATPase [Streptomyces sp. NBC_00847]MCX5421157.1 AAA family ATPase [Streptomyces sp. NBC_00078]